MIKDDKYSLANVYAHLDENSKYSYQPTNRVFGGLFVSVMFALD